MKNIFQTIKNTSLLSLVILMIAGCSLDISGELVETTFGNKALIFEFICFIFSFISGYTCIIAGIVFIGLGLSGNIELIVSSNNFLMKIANASPGIILIIAGVAIILIKKYKVKAKLENKNTRD